MNKQNKTNQERKHYKILKQKKKKKSQNRIWKRQPTLHLSPLPRINQLKVKIMVKKNNDKRQAINKKAKHKSIVVAKFGKTFGL